VNELNKNVSQNKLTYTVNQCQKKYLFGCLISKIWADLYCFKWKRISFLQTKKTTNKRIHVACPFCNVNNYQLLETMHSVCVWKL